MELVETFCTIFILDRQTMAFYPQMKKQCTIVCVLWMQVNERRKVAANEYL